MRGRRVVGKEALQLSRFSLDSFPRRDEAAKRSGTKTGVWCLFLHTEGNCLVGAGVYPTSRAETCALRKWGLFDETLCRFYIRVFIPDSVWSCRPDFRAGSIASSCFGSAA